MIEAVTVHVLREGEALCGFMNGAVPKDWPERHKWIDKEGLCEKCVKTAFAVTHRDAKQDPFEVHRETLKVEVGHGAHPIEIYLVKLETETSEWVERFGSKRELDTFMQGVRAACGMLGIFPRST